jgi:microcystin-dependent protein/GNAT superfamily N-acetyltransferase
MEFLFRLYASIRAEEKALVGWGDEEWDVFLRMQFNLQHSQYMGNYPHPSFDVIMLGRTPVGRLYVNREPEEIRIVGISLMPEYRGRGIGVGLMRQIPAGGGRQGRSGVAPPAFEPQVAIDLAWPCNRAFLGEGGDMGKAPLLALAPFGAVRRPGRQTGGGLHVHRCRYILRRSIMKYVPSNSFLSLALAATLFGPAAWSTAGYACPAEPILGGVCIMASARYSDITSPSAFALADGRVLQINQYSALFALLGATYGGNGSSTFALPDLRGRVVVGTNNNPNIGVPTYQIGAKGGAVTLTVGQLPAHAHGLVTASGGVAVTSGIGTLAANTTLAGLTATTTIGTLAAATTLTGLTATLKASSGAAAIPNPAGASLATFSGTNKYYVNAPPDTPMNASSVTVGGTAATTLSGSPATTIAGTATTQLTGAPSVAIGGSTQAAGGTSTTPIMPPYLALNYYISTQGYFPSYD